MKTVKKTDIDRIKAICKKHRKCYSCPFYNPDPYFIGCYFADHSRPFEWNPNYIKKTIKKER